MPAPRALDILAFEPYDAGSHRQVRASITRHSRHRWRWFTRPGRAWKWRMRLAALELAEAVRDAAPPVPDVIFATSLMSVPDLMAALPASFRSCPVILYMHENQVAYPAGRGGDNPRDVHFALTNLASVLVADLTIWNSDWNRCSFSEGLPAILAHAPEVTLTGALDRALDDSIVVWPPVELPPAPPVRTRALGTSVVWPHRWEYDKGPDELLETARAAANTPLTWTILGRRYTEVPDALLQLEKELGPRLDHFGPIDDRDAYWAHLARCDWVLSTAQHEFFGIAVVEAMLAGCLPWLPPRLSYPELLPACAHALRPDRPPADPAAIRQAIRDHLTPSIAANAVASLDQAVDDIVTRPLRGSNTP